MYSRDFEGIKSEGQLYNLEQEYNRQQHYDTNEETHNEPNCPPPQSERKPQKSGFSFLRNLETDDLILIGIGILLLLDSQEENDIFILIIALLLFF